MRARLMSSVRLTRDERRTLDAPQRFAQRAFLAEPFGEDDRVDAVAHVVVGDPDDRSDIDAPLLGEFADPTDHLAGEALRVEVALGGDDEIGTLDVLVEVKFIGDEIEAWEKSSSEGGESSGESSGGT